MSTRFVRWQGYAIGQLTFALNMFFGTSVAALAYSVAFLKEEVDFLCSNTLAVLQMSILSLCIAVFVSVMLVISRLLDFRHTARGIRESDADVSAVYKYKSKMLGRLTWRLFWTQVISMLVGLLALVGSMVSVYAGDFSVLKDLIMDLPDIVTNVIAFILGGATGSLLTIKIRGDQTTTNQSNIKVANGDVVGRDKKS